MPSVGSRKLLDSTMTVLTGLCALFAVASLFFILGYIFWGGLRGLSLGFLVNSPKPIGEPNSGIANAIVGSVIIIALGSAIGMPVGILSGIYLSEFGSNKFGNLLRFLIDTLTGTPSIVVGVFVWTVMVRPMGHFSALSGGVALGIMMMPIVARTTEEMIRLVPHSLREAALALGAPRWRTSLRIIAHTALAGILTGCLVGIARIAGETAPLLFTALGNLNFTTNVGQPMQTLSLQIFQYATGPFDEWHRMAWAAALVLMGLVLLLSLAARWAIRQRHGAAR